MPRRLILTPSEEWHPRKISDHRFLAPTTNETAGQSRCSSTGSSAVRAIFQQTVRLPGIVSGESMWCIGMSEPDAGSDVASLRTTAVLDGDEWVINGQKIWNSGGAVAEWCYLVARTDPDAPKHKGLSEFVVDMTSPGITVQPIRDMTDDEHFCEIYFDDVRVPGWRTSADGCSVRPPPWPTPAISTD